MFSRYRAICITKPFNLTLVVEDVLLRRMASLTHFLLSDIDNELHKPIFRTNNTRQLELWGVKSLPYLMNPVLLKTMRPKFQSYIATLNQPKYTYNLLEFIARHLSLLKYFHVRSIYQMRHAFYFYIVKLPCSSSAIKSVF